MTIKPTDDMILVRPEDDPETTTGGILLPDGNKPEGAAIGVVVAVGPGRRLEDGSRAPTQTKPGDRVAYKRVIHAGNSEHIEIDGEDHLLVRESSYVLAVLEEAKEG